MKTLFKIFLVILVLLAVAAGVGYFIVTRPAFQKKLVEGRLPEGSSVQFIHVTTGSVQLTDLNLRLPDGTTAKVDSLRSEFSPFAALFKSTLRLRGLTIDGLVVELPEMVAPSAPSGTTAPADTQSEPQVSAPASNAESEAPTSPTDALYALGEIDWLFDLDSINLNGALIDASRNRYAFDLASGQIAPGVETTLTANLQLESKQALQGGLKDFNSDLRMIFTQKQNGGFERLRVESLTEGSDAAGGQLLSISQTLELVVDSFGKTAEVDLSFNADLPRPAVFALELSALQGLSLQGEVKGSAEGDAFNLQTADLDAASNGASVASVKLKQSMTLGAEQQFAGELMDVMLSNLPLSWVNPWLGDGLRLSGAPLSAQIAVSGEKSGALQVQTLAPIQLGPFSLSQNGQRLLQEITLRMNPVVKMDADQTIRLDLGDFELLDRYGVFASGSLSGAMAEVAGDSPLAGVQAKARLDIGLAELLQQPVLDGKASVMAGQATVQLDVDGSAEYPAQIQTAIAGLRARELPGSRQDYRLALQLKQTAGGGYTLGSNFAAGSETRPSTSLQLGGQVNLDVQPMPFKVNLTAPLVTQSDIDLLIAAGKPQETATALTPSNATPPKTTGLPAPAPVSPTTVDTRPSWADLNGEIAIQIDELILASGQRITGLNAQATISEPLLEVSQIAAKLQDGSLGGNAKIAYRSSQTRAYAVTSALKFQDFDPSIFSQKPSGSFPVKGLFDGNFSLNGSGATLEAALEDSEADLLITGRDGVLTAFELDERSQLGLLGAGILGQSLDRPGITAMAQAVPYFKDMHFDSFTLELVRAQDKKVRIPQLSFLGDNLRLNGQGSIAASSLNEVLDQPLDLTLGLGAKGRLVDYLETLGLLQPGTSEDGFRSWNQAIKIGGSLGDPNTSALKDILTNAARRALQDPERSKPAANTTEGQDSTTPPAEEPKKKSKEDKRRDDIEMGIDLLNSVFG